MVKDTTDAGSMSGRSDPPLRPGGSPNQQRTSIASVSLIDLNPASRPRNSAFRESAGLLSRPIMNQTGLATLAREIAQDNLRLGLVGAERTASAPVGVYNDSVVGQFLTEVESKSEQMDGSMPYSIYNTYDTYYPPDHGTYGMLCPPFPGGIVRFIVDGGEEIKDRYYVNVSKESSADDIARFMAAAWRRRTPKLVLTVISSSQYYHPWTRDKFSEDFQIGMIQAASSTEMWIITEGVDKGISKLIGDAANIEMTRRKNMEQNPLHIKNISTVERLPRLNIFGILSKSSLVYSDVLTGQHINPQPVENTGGNPALNLVELNPDHSHFVLVEDGPTPDPDAVFSTRFALEMRFTKAVGKPRRYTAHQANISTLLGTGTDVHMPMPDSEAILTPAIGLLVQGGPPDIDHTLLLLKKKIPVVVILGSGTAADLVAFALQEMQGRGDTDYLDNYIKPELMRRVSEAFPDEFASNNIARNQCRDKIIECVKLSRQDDLVYLTVLNTSRIEVRLSDLRKYLLTALFKSQSRTRSSRQFRTQLQWDLQLTLDWNLPELARSEIFFKYNLSKFRVEEHVFHQALMRPDREPFVELFLEHGMVVHSYLNHRRLENLFENAADKDFFVGICLEGVLGKTVNMSSRRNGYIDNFVDDVSCELNRLLYKITGLSRLVNPYELSMNSLGSYVTDVAVAERRAINALIFWAVLTNRQELAKVLWKRSDEPMAVALVVSMLLHNLGTKWCRDIDMKSKTIEAGKEFGRLAVSILQTSYKQSSSLTFASLSKQLEDFNNWSVVELAKFSCNKYFLAHHCCQKWMSQRWLGHIAIRDLDWGIFALPDWFKIYSSVLLVFPMFMFISFTTAGSFKVDLTEDEEELDDTEDHDMLLRVGSVEEKLSDTKQLTMGRRRYKPFPKTIRKNSRRKTRVKVTFQGVMAPEEEKVALWKQIYYLYTAPITKFWLHLLFYIVFLVIISIALLMPACGQQDVDIILVIWTCSIWMEGIRRACVRKRMYPEMSIKWSCFEIFIMLLFMVLMMIRILHLQFISFTTVKFFMACGLLFFYFRTLSIFLPISPTLGPMLVSIIIMVKQDFINWMRLFLMVLVSGAITIHAVIYPSFPLSYRSIRTAFSRAIFGLFLTKIDDLDGNPSCSYMYDNKNVQYCMAEKSLNRSQLLQLEECPVESFFNYAVVIPYLYNAKLIFSTLLYAMFATTCNQVEKAAVEIWKYQRYEMIVDFEHRMVLPPPLAVFCYIYHLICFGCYYCGLALHRCCHDVHCCQRLGLVGQEPSSPICKLRQAVDYNHWKDCINSYIEEEQKLKVEQQRARTQSESLNMLMEEVQQHRLLSRHLNDRIVHLETQFTNSCLLLEEMKHMIKRLDPKTPALPQASKNVIHVSARQSPYPGTSIRRFPVFDKYVPWEVPYETYDPACYTRPVDEFTARLRCCVDPDILKIKEEAARRAQMTQEELEEADLPLLPEFEPMYNALLTTVADDVNVEVDRTSWISQNNQPLRYKLDASGVPQNPVGRTGIRGRGKLWRWGPNHRIAAVVTRWRRKYSSLGFPLDHLLVDGKRVLEFLVIKQSDTGELTLPGGNVYGKTTAYSVMCEEFLKSVLLEPEVEGSLKLDQDDMINYFSLFAKATGTTSTSTDSKERAGTSGFSASILYRGYIDDPSNTDNAWREAEVWNFHYELYDMFDDKIKEKEKMWREVSPYMRLFGNQDSIVMEAARIHGAYV